MTTVQVWSYVAGPRCVGSLGCIEVPHQPGIFWVSLQRPTRSSAHKLTMLLAGCLSTWLGQTESARARPPQVLQLTTRPRRAITRVWACCFTPDQTSFQPSNLPAAGHWSCTPNPILWVSDQKHSLWPSCLHAAAHWTIFTSSLTVVALTLPTRNARVLNRRRHRRPLELLGDLRLFAVQRLAVCCIASWVFVFELLR